MWVKLHKADTQSSQTGIALCSCMWTRLAREENQKEHVMRSNIPTALETLREELHCDL
jgi:hypothetical protein